MSGVVQVAWRESTEELYARYRDERDVQRRKRLQALWLLRQGRNELAASREAGVGRRSLQRWLGWYRTEGLDGVLARVPGHGARGVPGRLTSAQRGRLLARVADGQFRTYDEAREWVEREWGVAYRYTGIYSLLARLDGHPKVPRPQAEKADAAAQEGWKRGACERR